MIAHSSMTDISKKFSTIAFDLDGTLAESKSAITPEMSDLICKLLARYNVAVVSGGAFPQFQKQFLSSLKCTSEEILHKLYIFPTSGSALRIYKDGTWHTVYEELLSENDKEQILDAWKIALAQSGVTLPTPSYGHVIEDRGAQMTFSACGQDAPISVKGTWDPDQKKRLVIQGILQPLLPNFAVNIGGLNTIDITRKGVDKAYAMEKIMLYLNETKDDIMFVGDKLEPGGNDYAARRSGVTCVAVADPAETAEVIRKLISDVERVK